MEYTLFFIISLNKIDQYCLFQTNLPSFGYLCSKGSITLQCILLFVSFWGVASPWKNFFIF